MCPYELTDSISDDVIRLSRNTCVQASRRHGGTGIGLSPSQAAVAQCSRPDLEAEDVSGWCARRLRLFIFPPEHCTPACARLSDPLGRPSNSSRHAFEGCLLMSAQLSSGEQSSLLAIACLTRPCSMLPSWIPAPTSFENVFAGKNMGHLPMRALQSCKALMFLALAGLEAKANRDSCMALGPPPVLVGLGRIVRFSAMSTEETAPGRSSAESLARDSGDVLGVELLQPSKAGRFFVETASQEHSNSGAGSSGGSSRPGLCRLDRRLTAQDGRPYDDASTQRKDYNSAERQTQAHRFVKHSNSALVVGICRILDQILPKSHRQHCNSRPYVTKKKKKTRTKGSQRTFSCSR